MVRGGKAWAVATEDMDALTFGAPRVLRYLLSAEKKKLDVHEYHHDEVIKGLGLTHDQFVDLCILSGCDYCNTIFGVGNKTALKLIKEWGSIEEALEHLTPRQEKGVPSVFKYKEARKLFNNPHVTPAKDIELKWKAPDEEGVIEFLSKKEFSPDQVRKSIQKIVKAKKQGTQMRLDAMFGFSPSPSKPKTKSRTSKGSGGNDKTDTMKKGRKKITSATKKK
eukprot:gnl/Carplike_NY0171/6606_a9069_156.p1 GENE.gnl/Carplike_NY0171/6606_a9069_156~~gnl/Carplike_NY0171/6606_a9069_156.p1  ORF type:complete len:238 (-),score=66.53 gnl/Carplike_NY0171/6606_a9069_156:33-698(-)